MLTMRSRARERSGRSSMGSSRLGPKRHRASARKIEAPYRVRAPTVVVRLGPADHRDNGAPRARFQWAAAIAGAEHHGRRRYASPGTFIGEYTFASPNASHATWTRNRQ